jgi:hypothetical protein
MRGKCLLKYRRKLKKKMFVNLDRHVFWTPFPDENFKKIKKRKKKGGGRNFTNIGESIRDINEGSRE